MVCISSKEVPNTLICYIETFLQAQDRGWKQSSKSIHQMIKKDMAYAEKMAHHKALRVLSPQGIKIQLKQERLSIYIKNPSHIALITGDILDYTYSLGVASCSAEDVTLLCDKLCKQHKRLEKLVFSHVCIDKQSWGSLSKLTHASHSQVTLHQATGYTDCHKVEESKRADTPEIIQTKENLTIEDALGIEMHLPTIFSFFQQIEKDQAENILATFNALPDEDRNAIIHELWRIVCWNTPNSGDKEYPLKFLLENIKEPQVQAAVWSYIETLKSSELLT